MKKLLLLICLTSVIIGKLNAGHKNSILNLSLPANGLFAITLDENVYESNCKKFRTENLKPGMHLLKVVKHNINNRHCFTPGRVIFNDYIYIEPSCEIFATIDRLEGFKVCKIIKLYDPFLGNCRFGCINACDHYDNYNDHQYFDNAPNCMSSADFNNLKFIIQSKWFDSSKKQIAVQVIASNFLTSMQIRELLLLFDFESTRLEFAKFAYIHASDPQNFYLTYDAFDFESSVHSLNKCIAFKN